VVYKRELFEKDIADAVAVAVFLACREWKQGVKW
jgi:Holliday junction resolvasome RuvABC endonuclease subunit